MYELEITTKFKKDSKLAIKRGLNQNLLLEVIDILVETGEQPKKYKAHKLIGNYKGYWECHIQVDWLLIWDRNETIK
jgi:mRNA interferase YafQ